MRFRVGWTQLNVELGAPVPTTIDVKGKDSSDDVVEIGRRRKL